MPSEAHESICRKVRGDYLKRGYKEEISPMPSFRPDVFAVKRNGNGKFIEQVVAEAEIERTLFYEHSIEQLILMVRFLKQEKKRGLKSHGILAVPKKTHTIIQAQQLIRSIDGGVANITVVGVSV